jgi:hypothetical protein
MRCTIILQVRIPFAQWHTIRFKFYFFFKSQLYFSFFFHKDLATTGCETDKKGTNILGKEQVTIAFLVYQDISV